MGKKAIAIVLEIIPVLSAIVSFILIVSPYESAAVRRVIAITILLAFLGFAFFIVCRKLAKGSSGVLVLGVLDLLATVYVIGLYAVVIMSFGL